MHSFRLLIYLIKDGNLRENCRHSIYSMTVNNQCTHSYLCLHLNILQTERLKRNVKLTRNNSVGLLPFVCMRINAAITRKLFVEAAYYYLHYVQFYTKFN